MAIESVRIASASSKQTIELNPGDTALIVPSTGWLQDHEELWCMAVAAAALDRLTPEQSKLAAGWIYDLFGPAVDDL